ncbi:helix-turn-helix domain-containing protein [Solihabitans fulvus]|uniref:Helix-turn-helix domain-containing protein n=1 Tax=Solihabitans fulvus TaxID=1892852 RepID=A0A5B2X4N0_9PSEU|nr:helix-turn-helix transcriptional regulator [Solihabitans fulvus]KAA2258042.1 helix-turn-helix domain-containing protein [Solihabitans fulvus]
MANTQTRRRRKLGAYLQELRKRANLTPEDVGAFLDISRPTINRVESGHTRCRRAELQAMLGYYQVAEQERAKALSLWDDAKDDATKIRFPARSSSAFRNFLQAETEATTLDVLDPYLVSGLLQTADYARAVQLPTASPYAEKPAEVERYVASRLNRQHRLSGANPLRLRAFLDEGVIRRIVGGSAVMIEQLVRLLEIGTHDNIQIRVIPVSVGAYGTMSGGVTVVGFDDLEDPYAAYLEHAGGGAWVEDAEATQRYVHMFNGLDAVALSESATAELIRHQTRALEGL